jgi:large subunit ribosomal protein L10
MSKELKRMMAESVQIDLDRGENVLVLGMLPLNAEDTVVLRNTLRSQGARLRVIHNRTSTHALDESRKGLADYFVGQTAIAVGETEETDFIGIAKTLVGAAKKKQIECRGGYVDGELFDTAGFEALALSPDKPTLRAMICGAILGPGRGLATLMNAVGGGMARCVQQRIDESPEAAAEAPAATSEATSESESVSESQ